MIHQGYSSLIYDEVMLYDKTQRFSRQWYRNMRFTSKDTVRACVVNHVRLFAAPWTAAHQAPLFKDFSRQEYRSGFPRPPPGDLPDSGIKPSPPALAGGFFSVEPPGKPRDPYSRVLNPTSRRRQWHPTPVLLPGKSLGWRSLVGCSPWGP